MRWYNAAMLALPTASDWAIIAAVAFWLFGKELFRLLDWWNPRRKRR
jgi:hypothetical protein